MIFAAYWPSLIGLLGFYGISSIVSYLMPSPLFMNLFVDNFKCFDFRPIIWQASRLGLSNILTASLQRSKTPPNHCPGYDIKQSYGEAPVMLELWEMRSTPSLLPVPLWPGAVAPERGQIGLFDIKLCTWTFRLSANKKTYAILNCLK